MVALSLCLLTGKKKLPFCSISRLIQATSKFHPLLSLCVCAFLNPNLFYLYIEFISNSFSGLFPLASDLGSSCFLFQDFRTGNLDSGVCSMDEMASRFTDLELGLENEVTTVGQLLLAKVVEGGSTEGSDNRASLSGGASNSGRVNAENSQSMKSMDVKGQDSKDVKQNMLVKEKLKSLGHKKPSKPPRPPRAPSLDAADLKLIREIAELAKLKRARIERMKALKKSNAASAAKPTSSSSSNMFAMVFTVIFCLVILFQGMSPGGTPTSYQGSPLPAAAVEGSPNSLQLSGNLSASFRDQAHSASP
ncbi:uncharacterized protein LOC120209527 isoform X2 [Hibiscus syriacus]|nr:uncharacterized protein LOC120209527 isoform X2 [Hibiscus syriacus]